MEFQKTMMLVTSRWASGLSFALIPVHKDAPYIECIYDIQSKRLVILSKDHTQVMKMVPKLTTNGDLKFSSTRKDVAEGVKGKNYEEERMVLTMPHEMHIINKDEIKELIELHAINHQTFFAESPMKDIFNDPGTSEIKEKELIKPNGGLTQA